MGGKDDDRNDFDRLMSDVGKDLASTRKELERVMEELRRELPSPYDALDDLRKQRDQSSDGNPRRGPFERFKSFVDSNFALLSDGFKNFPANVQELKEKMQEEREARRVEELDIWRRWTGSDDSPDHIRMQTERASKDDKQSVTAATFMLLRESFERNKHVSPQKILDLYRDDEWVFGSLDQFATPMLSFGGACYYKPETVQNLPSTARWGWPSPTQRWLSVEWFKRSPYSPVRLEAHPDLVGKGEKWRAAFEDLLLVSLDKPMQTTEKVGQRIPAGKPQSTYFGPGLDWMLSLQCRGILPPQLPNFYRHYRQETGNEWFKPAHTRILPDLDAIASKRPHCMYPRAEADIHALMDEVGIQAQPDTDAFSQPIENRTAQSPWQVPETEAELCEQMKPVLMSAEQLSSLTGDKDVDLAQVQSCLEDSLERRGLRDFLDIFDALYDFEQVHGVSNSILDNIIVCMDPREIDDLWDYFVTNYPDPAWIRRFEERVDLHERWQDAFRRAGELGVNVEQWHVSGASVDDVESQLDDLENGQILQRHGQQRRIERALAKAEKLGYDFHGWDWQSLPLEELEAELEREENYTNARRRAVLSKAARLGYDFNGWEYEGLPVQELEDEMLRMEQYAKRDAVGMTGAEQVKRPDVLSQLTTTETMRMPDGTVTTKTVLKRRFADGREETKESVHTSNEPSEAKQAEEKSKREKEKTRGKGWFWT